jgi:NhaA family Na+:H+ antiporter
MATDIAFVVGAMSLLGRRVPPGLKVFLVALAIVDDIGAIVVIAAVFTGGVDARWLLLALASALAVLALRAAGVARPAVYLVPGAGLWWAAFRAGVHPTLAGVALGLIVPAAPVRGRRILDDLELLLHPWSSFLVVPVFALANAGVVLSGETIGDALVSRVFWGVTAGLVAGKGAGIFASSAGAELLGVGRRPRGVDRPDLAGAALLAGIGFTVSLFIAPLAFAQEELLAEAKMGILAGSLVSAGLATIVFLAQDGRRASRGRASRGQPA